MEYITLDTQGELSDAQKKLTSLEASELLGADDALDVAYQLSRIAHEAASELDVAPNAIDAGALSGFTTVTMSVSPVRKRSNNARTATDQNLENLPRVLVMSRSRNSKPLLAACAEAGFATIAPTTNDKRFESHLKCADQTVTMGEKYSEQLFANSHAVLEAARACDAKTILLCDEALSLAEVDSFLARAKGAGVRVFKPLNNATPLLGWTLCETKKPAIDQGSWRTCAHCGLKFDESSLAVGHYVCPGCGEYIRMSAHERINDLLDDGSFVELNNDVTQKDPLNFPGYVDKLDKLRETSGIDEAIVTGTGRIAGLDVAIGIMDSRFLMGSMGTVVGEKVVRLVEHAQTNRLPLVLFCASGGARMQEGLMSLMQMAKVSCALEQYAEEHLPYISVLTDPTTGGVTASFAMQGDIILAEPRALIGFAGQRVIKDTIKQELPPGFQTAEFALSHGLIDAIVPREELRSTLAHLLAIHHETLQRNNAPQPGDRALLITYEAVQNNLERGSGTYNAVTYGDLNAEIIFEGESQNESSFLPRNILSNYLNRKSHATRKRLERMLNDRAFDAEGGELLIGDTLLNDELSSRTLDTQSQTADNKAWESVMLARNVHRPTAMSYINDFVEGFIELHGDRAFGDDGAIVSGLGWIDGVPVTIIAQEKGRDLKERITRNFGCPQPEGYRKSLRLMKQAEKFGRPVVCLVDTQGAFCGTEAEERGQGNAIADNLIALAGLRVPVVSVLLGEGGSGGALALALADRVAMQEHAVYSILSPEGFASILWKDRSRAPEAASVMKMNAHDVFDMGIIDAVLPEGEAPAHENPQEAIDIVHEYISQSLTEIRLRDVEELCNERKERFLKF